MEINLVLVLSVSPSFGLPYSIALVKLNEGKEKYYLLKKSSSMTNFDIINEGQFLKEDFKVLLSDYEIRDIFFIMSEIRIPPITESFIGLDSDTNSLHFYDGDGSANSSFSWWGDIPNEWSQLGILVEKLKSYFKWVKEIYH